jgi:Lon protease-like protein
MFPLGSVLLPGGVLPLHVFEPRYRRLVEDCLAAEAPEFGVTLIERGFEVGGGDQRCAIGTVARMVQVAELADGRYAIVSVGTRRVQVEHWLPDDPYPRAEVSDLPDDLSGAGELNALERRLTSRIRRAAALATELGDSCVDATESLRGDPVAVSYQLAAMAPLGPADAYRLLAAPGPAHRLDLLDELLDDVEAALQFRLATSADDQP